MSVTKKGLSISFLDAKHQSSPSAETTDPERLCEVSTGEGGGIKSIIKRARERSRFVHSEDRSVAPDSRPWKTTLIRFGPLPGILCMLLGLASIIASLGILIGSNRKPVAHWTAPPPTYLAIFTAIANLAMRYACIQGVIIAWWVRASRGSSVEKLPHDWRAGTTLQGALTSGRHLGVLGLACIASTAVIIDGPLLQRASTVVPAPFDQPVPLEVTMVPQIPSGFTGLWQTIEDLGQEKNWWATAFRSTMPASNGTVPNNIYSTMSGDVHRELTRAWFYQELPLSGVVRGCPDKCKAKLVAPALAVRSCTSHQQPADFNHPWDSPRTNNYRPSLDQQSFFIANTLVIGEKESINLVTGYTTLEHCAGLLNYTACSLESAVGEYEVSIVNNTIEPLYSKSAGRPTILALSNNAQVNQRTDPRTGYHSSTLAGIVNLHWSKWDASCAMYKQNGEALSWSSGNGAVFTYMQQPDTGKCPSFDDPMPDMLSSLNTLTVYSGMFAAKQDSAYLKSTMEPRWADSVNTTIIGRHIGHQNVFQTDFTYFIAAAIVEIVCVILVAPTYIGWWKLGRPVSFSPVELAKAFRSPLVSDCNSNSSGRDIAKSMGGVRMRYGATKGSAASERRRLEFADPSFVDDPQGGERFDI